MRYEFMLPHQIRAAIDARWPVALPIGVLEYHGEHMAVGMDTLAVVKTLELVEKEIDLVILPPFYYGAASYAVEKPEGNGSVQVSGKELAPFAEALFFSLLRIGFRNIHAIIHHQTENFEAGMPTDLAFKLAGRQAIFRFIERESGEGWWGNEEMANYYAQHAAGIGIPDRGGGAQSGAADHLAGGELEHPGCVDVDLGLGVPAVAVAVGLGRNLGLSLNFLHGGTPLR